MRTSFIERAEQVLIVGMVAGIVLILQRYNLQLFQLGLSVLVISTLLQIAVGNVPKSHSAWRSIVMIAGILAIVAAVFGLGVMLVPTLARLGR